MLEQACAMTKAKENILSVKPTPEETGSVESAIRPQSLTDFVGQDRLKENLQIFITAARARGEALDHCLLYSPPGLGKTTLAHIISREMGVNLKGTSGPALERAGDLAAMLTTELAEGDVLFIDEIHRLSPVVEEALYPVMEDFSFFINTGKGAGSTTVKLAVPRFTLIGATTRSGLLTGPLRDRFGIVFNLGFYNTAEIEKIISRSAGILHVRTDREGVSEIAKRARGTPRIANRLLRRLRDFAQVKGSGVISGELARSAMDSLEIDPEGLDASDRRFLATLVEKFKGGPVGIETMAVAVSEEIDTLTDVVEPFLMQAGFLARTPRGRVATQKTYSHLGVKYPKKADELF